MYRTVALILALTGVFFVVRSGEEPVRALQTPEVRPAPEAFEAAGDPSAKDGIPVGQAPDESNPKIGGFEKPARVPDYEVLEERIDERDGASAARLLIDTRSREEDDFVLIARDLKARYSDYDAVSVEFTDTEVLSYNGDAITRDALAYYGGALIFNTYDGSAYLGYIYAPPNMEGYYVKAAD